MKTLKIIFITSLIFSFYLLDAALLTNIPMQISQPDGELINCFASGDEFFNRLHDADGYTIIQSMVDGYYYYAIKDIDEIIPSVYRVNSVDPATVGISPYIVISQAEYQARRARYLEPMQEANRAPTSGTINNLVVYIRFNDQSEFVSDRCFFDQKFNDVELGAESMINYYHEVSYDALTINSYHYPECELTTNLSYQDSHPRGYFSPYNPTTNPIGYSNDTQKTQREHQLLADAIAYIEPEVPESLDIDADCDGEVDNVCFIIRGPSDGWSDLLWAHRWVLYSMFVYLNGKRVYGYTFQPETQVEVSTLNHEMFHALGAPDLYHYEDGGSDPNGPFSSWDIMNGANVHMSAYMKYRYGNWIEEIPEITQPGEYSLLPLTCSTNNCYKISSPNCTYEYFVVEYRKQIPDTFEMNIPGSGLIISRVNTLLDGQGNSNGPPDELYLFRPGGSPTTSGNVNIAHFALDWGRTEFNDETDPYCFLSNGDMGGIFIHQVGPVGDYISFIYDPQIGFFNGTVTSDNPEVDLMETEIYIDGIILNPNPYGYFEYAHYQGVYDITANLHGHTIQTQEIEILPFETITVDFDLIYLDPPYDLTYSLSENMAELSWQFDHCGEEDFLHFNIYRKILDFSYTLIASTEETSYETLINPSLEYHFYVEAEYLNGYSDPSNEIMICPSETDEEIVPQLTYNLEQNFPNPFNPITTIRYSLKESGFVSLIIYNIKGEVVRQLVAMFQDPGTKSVEWDGRNDQGNPMPSGIYLYKLNTKKYETIKKMLMLK